MKKILLLLTLCYSFAFSGYDVIVSAGTYKQSSYPFNTGNAYYVGNFPTIDYWKYETTDCSVINSTWLARNIAGKNQLSKQTECVIDSGTSQNKMYYNLLTSANWIVDWTRSPTYIEDNTNEPEPLCTYPLIDLNGVCYEEGTQATCSDGNILLPNSDTLNTGSCTTCMSGTHYDMTIEGCAPDCVPHALTPPINNPEWENLGIDNQTQCFAKLEYLEIDGTFTIGDNGCGTEISTCFGDPNSACWEVADINEIIGDTDFIYKGLVSNDFECQADGVNYMMAFTEETNPNCNRVNNLYCFKLPFNKEDSNLTGTVTAPTTTEDLNTSERVSTEDIKNINDNPSLYISSIDSKLGEISKESSSYYRDSLGKLQKIDDSINSQTSQLDSSLEGIKNADKSSDILDYISQDVQGELDGIKAESETESESAFTEIGDKISDIIPTYSSDYIGTVSSCGSFYLSNQSFSILGGSSSFDMSSINNLMNSSDADLLYNLMKIFLYFYVALSSFKIFVKVG